MKPFSTFADILNWFRELDGNLFDGLIQLLDLGLGVEENLLISQVSDVYDDALFAVKNDFVAQETNYSIVLGFFSYVVFGDFSLGRRLLLLLLRANVVVSHS